MDQNTRNTRGALAGTKKKTTTVRDVVDGDDIPDLQLQITSWRTQMTRSAPAKQSGDVGEGQRRVVTAQHGLSVPIDNVAAGGKPFKARQWGTVQRDGIRTADCIADDAEMDTWQNVW